MAAEGIEMPKTSRMKNLLMELGFTQAGVLCFNSKSGRVFVRKRVRNALQENGTLNTKWAQTTLKKHNAEVEKKIGKPKNPFDDEDDDEV